MMWDNRCTMHRRDGFDPNTIRIMHRTTTSGERPSDPAMREQEKSMNSPYHVAPGTLPCQRSSSTCSRMPKPPPSAISSMSVFQVAPFCPSFRPGLPERP